MSSNIVDFTAFKLNIEAKRNTQKRIESLYRSDGSTLSELHIEAEHHNVDARYDLAQHYRFGIDIDEDLEKAAFWFLKAAEQGHADSQYCIASAYDFAEGIEEDKEKAVYWYEKASEQGHSVAQYFLGRRYEDGDGVAQDLEKAAYWFQQSAEQGDDAAQHALGMCYLCGEGLEEDYEKAIFWFRKSAEHGDEDAKAMLDALQDAKFYGDASNVKYVRGVIEKAQQGNANAQFRLARWYEEGSGVDLNFNQAFFWLTKAAAQGDADAQRKLDKDYDANGQSKKEKEKEEMDRASRELRKIAESGDVDAIMSLAFQSGLTSQKEQFYWFLKAAEKENPRAQYYVGQAYEEGDGIDKDIEKAHYWYKKAAAQGDEEAKQRLKKCSFFSLKKRLLYTTGLLFNYMARLVIRFAR